MTLLCTFLWFTFPHKIVVYTDPVDFFLKMLVDSKYRSLARCTVNKLRQNLSMKGYSSRSKVIFFPFLAIESFFWAVNLFLKIYLVCMFSHVII